MFKRKIKKGDIFSIKLKNNIFCYGQVLSDKNKYGGAVIIYDICSKGETDVSNILSKDIVFFANITYNKLIDGSWKIIQNVDLPKDIVYPLYIEETLKDFNIVSFEGKILRKADESEIEKFKYLESYTWDVLLDALNWKYNNGEWYDELNNLML